MNLYDLGRVPWLESQLIYHALPRLGMEGLVFLAPAEPYVCLGYHQDAEQEVDLAYCREAGIPVFRREVGGGAVFLDGQQIFYQLVIRKDNPLAPRDKLGFYQKFLTPVVETYRTLGVDARFRPVNDIITAEGRKISGNGAAEIGDYSILVGNIIVDFDYETMARVLRVPDAKFRDKVFKSLRENLTTLNRELGLVPASVNILDILLENFEAVLGPLESAELPDPVYDQVAELAQAFTTEEWLLKPGKRFREGRRVKIAEGIEVVERMHKAPGGLIRAMAEIQRGQIVAVGLSGDFFFYPADQLEDLEQYLIGAALPEVLDAITEFYRTRGIDSPGVTPFDLAVALGAEAGIS
jgi:lipoate-protein ligase A